MKQALVAALMVSLALAGCTSDDPTEDDNVVQGHVDQGDDVLEAGKGAIEGLLVDDRFRPLHLTQAPQTEFQFEGFLFIPELGLQVETNENGEFTVLDLEPGTYTIRPQVDRHDGFTKTVRVEEGLFADAQILVRRINSEGSVILTEEYTGFAPCVVPGVISNCLDASAESYRPGPQGLNYSGFPDVTYVIVEVAVNQPEPNLYVQCRGNGVYSEILLPPGTGYAKAILRNDANETYDHPFNVNPWANPNSWECIVFVNIDDPTSLTPAFGVKTQFLISIFLGEPDVDLETYQLLTEDSS